ncbi:MAG: polysaccharide biosynthesis protein [Firmicutes bacterium]|jgi:stage V sporulation protein B|nr:polysaccharide biosynthesis protein [Bacillota bacterium]MBR6504104.1 polysaccharide biosynthesis protein [Bacillota bacterium]
MKNAAHPKSFVRGAAVLGLAGLMVQALGALFRIPLANIIGDEGMGYFQTAYPVYIFILIFSTNGVPAAISQMVSGNTARGNYSEAHRIFRISFVLMIAVGVVSALAVWLLAGPIVRFFGDPGAYYAMAAIAPALLIVPVMAVFRGYFQGFQIMEPTAGSQIVEQVVRVAVGLTLAVVLLPKGVAVAAAAASGAGSIGPVFGALFIILVYRSMRKKSMLPFDSGNASLEKPEPGKSILRRLVGIAVPITIGVSIFPIMNMVDLLVVMRRLEAAGFSAHEANGLYGQLSGYAGPVVNLPQSLALAMALSLVPAIAAAKSIGDRRRMNNNIRLGLRVAIMIGVPCAFGIMAIPQQLMDLIYPARAGQTETAAKCLFLLGLGVIFICVAQAMAGILQGLGKPGRSVVGIIIGAAVKYLVSYILVGMPELNVSGAAIGTSAGLFAAAMVNYHFVRRLTGTRHNMKRAVLLPVLCGIASVLVAVVLCYGVGHFTGSHWVTFLAVVASAVVYCVMLIKTKAILPKEVKAFPKGEKIYRLLKKVRLA